MCIEKGLPQSDSPFLSYERDTLLKVFYDASRTLAAADAERSETIFAADFFQAVEQGYEDTSAGCANRMTEGDSTAMDVDFAHVKAEFTAAVYSLSCESFVSFDEVEVFDFEACFSQRFAGRRNRAGTHDSGINTSRCIAYDFSHRFEAEFFGFISGHNYESSCAVVDAGSVASRNCAAFFEGRFQFSERFHVGVFARAFISVDDDILFLLMNRNRNDLGFECAAVDSFASKVLRTNAEFILVFTGYVEAFSDVFSRDAHMVVIESVPKAVFDHRIDEDTIAHAIAITSFRYCERSHGHVFHAACYDDVSVAGFDHLSCQRYATETGTADFVDCQCRNFDRHAGFDHSLTSRVLALSCLKDVAHYDFVDIFAFNTSAFEGFFDNNCTEFNSRRVFEAAAEFTDCRTASTYDNYIFHWNHSLKIFTYKIGVGVSV